MLFPALAVGLILVAGGAMALRPKNTAQVETTSSNRPAAGVQLPADKFHLFVGADVSASVNSKLRETAFDGLRFTLRQALPLGTPVHFVFYDTSARTSPTVVEFFEPRDLDEIGDRLKKYPPRAEKGTQQALALQRLETEANDLPSGTPVGFILLTDGEDQDRKATKAEAQKLAERPGFQGLMVIGAQMESSTRIPLRDQLHAALAPLGNKNLVCGEEVSDRDANVFSKLINSKD
jgi:hypothetical protein